MPELLIIGFIVMLLFGPGKLAGLGQGLGDGIRGFKKALAGDDEKPVEGKSETTPPAKLGPGDGSRA
jgi:sec-independent protein translocase protein TatA